MTYNQSVKDFQEKVRHSLVMLQSDPHFKQFLEVMEEGRNGFYRQASQVGISQKDQDKLLGAAFFADQTISQARLIINKANGRLNAGFDSDEQNPRG